MSVIDTTPEVTQVTLTKTQRYFEHYVCCEIPDTSHGVTRAFCGEMVIFEGRNKGGEICPVCSAMATMNGCPLGSDCRVQDI